MPNRGSWNGRWSGEDNKYYITRKVSDKTSALILGDNDAIENSYYYRWNDGWGANVRVQLIDGKTAAKRRKISKGFCGYDWMVDSIVLYQEISTSNERKERALVV